MVKVISTDKFREILDSFIQKEFMESLTKVQIYNNREMTDRESALLMKGFEMGFIKGVKRVIDSFPTYRQILLDMLKEIEQTKVSAK